VSNVRKGLRLHGIFLICSVSVREHLVSLSSDGFPPIRIWQRQDFLAVKPAVQFS
jgi:hypothetical protein